MWSNVPTLPERQFTTTFDHFHFGEGSHMSFENAAVTKGLMVGLGLTSILVGLFDVKHYFHLQLVPHLSRHHQYWRLAAHHLAFPNSSDLFVAVLVLYNVSVQVERQFGSVKFASYVLISTLMNTILEFVTLLLFHQMGFNHIETGPAALIFGILYQYSRIVPPTYNYRIFGLPLNNKSPIYLLALQMALGRLPSSAVVALLGVLTGQIYRSDLANLKGYRVSPTTLNFSMRFLKPLIGSLRPPRRSNRALPDGSRTAPTSRPSSQNEEVITTARPTTASATAASRRDSAGPGSGSVVREWVNELTGRTEGATSGIRVPTEAEITQVSNMFPDVQRDVVIAALQRSPSVQAAVETLLSSQS